MKPKVYLETSFIGYLTMQPQRNPLVLAHQQLTTEWWERRRASFDLFVSEIVLEEVARGDAEAARERLAIVENLAVLRANDQAKRLAAAILKSAALPPKAVADATHIAIATINAMDFLLTWNCTHIANGIVLRRVSVVCREMNLEPPIVCTPEELMEG